MKRLTYPTSVTIQGTQVVLLRPPRRDSDVAVLLDARCTMPVGFYATYFVAWSDVGVDEPGFVFSMEARDESESRARCFRSAWVSGTVLTPEACASAFDGFGVDLLNWIKRRFVAAKRRETR